jgi:nitroimidazol reductase NimA-like FMN-containing flavoprotein (pyridoxamine 5'-phosphate oxidase superfamily)
VSPSSPRRDRAIALRLTEEETWQVLAESHTGILTTLRRDGWPVSLPVWFVALDRLIFITTPAGSKKVVRVRHDERACFVVESGLAWQELRAVVIPARARIEDNQSRRERVISAWAAKYAGFRFERDKVPQRTVDHYRQPSAIIRLEPGRRILTWDNSRLRSDRNETEA